VFPRAFCADTDPTKNVAAKKASMVLLYMIVCFLILPRLHSVKPQRSQIIPIAVVIDRQFLPGGNRPYGNDSYLLPGKIHKILTIRIIAMVIQRNIAPSHATFLF